MSMLSVLSKRETWPFHGFFNLWHGSVSTTGESTKAPSIYRRLYGDVGQVCAPPSPPYKRL